MTDKTVFNAQQNSASPTGTAGFTLIELMIVVAIIAIILTLALPVYSNYTIRAKVAEALSIAAPAVTATTDTCQSDNTILALTKSKAGFDFTGSTYVASIEIDGPCSAPVITITTQNTGATTAPVLILTGDSSFESGRFAWTCTTENGQTIYVPKTCRS